MSLINEALKKAQRQRGDGVPPATPPFAGAAMPPSTGGSHRAVPRRAPLPARTLGLLGGGGLLAVVGIVTALLWPKATPPPAVRPAPTVATTNPTTPVVAPVTAVVAPPTITFPVPVPTPAVVVPAPPPPVTPAPPPVVVAPVVEVAPAKPPVVTAPVVMPPAEAVVIAPAVSPEPLPPAPRPSQRVEAFLDTIHVSGILASGNPPKVLMNGQVYKPGDIVDRATNLRLTQIATHSLTFTDAAGFDYIKNF